ncbi:MAG: OmpA family protein [Clostridia bacterium]
MKRSEPENYWPSFADVMSTMVLIMLFLVLIVFIKNIIISINLDEQEATNIATGTQLETTRNDLAAKELALLETEQELEEQRSILIMLENSLEAKGIELINLETELEAKQEALNMSEAEATNLENLIIILGQQQAELEAQKSELLGLIALNTIELESMRDQLQTVAVLQATIFETVKAAIDKALGPGKVSITDDANLQINEAVLFETKSWVINPSAYALLDKLAAAFEDIIDESGSYIESIVVEGHASADGDYYENLMYSSNRAEAVLAYLMKSNPDLETKYQKYFGAMAYSESRPISIILSQNRRIEFSIILKDDNAGQIIQDYLDKAE